jgi:hypothetical protein
MSEQNIFELASRKKFRFESKVGLLSVEELWELPLSSKTKANLDEVAILINSRLKQQTESFVGEGSAVNKDDELRLELVKHIISVRKAEVAAATEKVERAEQRARIDALIQKKQDQKLEETPLEDLLKLRDSI